MEEKNIITSEIIQDNSNIEEPSHSPSLWEKIKAFFTVIGVAIYGLRCVCCFTSVLALANLSIFIGGDWNISDFWVYVILGIGLLGVISGLIACPLKLILSAVKIITSCATFGLIFTPIGAVIGIIVGLLISIALIFLAPAIITIPHFFSGDM